MDKTKYSVCEPWILRIVCVRNGWFNAGTNEQYDKLFYANENGYSLDAIAAIIWACTETEYGYYEFIKVCIREERREYLMRLGDAQVAKGERDFD